MKTCVKCKEDKTNTLFYRTSTRKDGLQPWCKECSRAWRVSSPEVARRSDAKLKEKYPEKYKARQAVRSAVRSGEMTKPSSCERCDETAQHGHHADYSKPLDVEWLCRPCHTAEHHRG